MTRAPALALAALLVLAGCTGTGPTDDTVTTAPTTETTRTTQPTPSTTEPHTHQGTSHTGTHLQVHADDDVGNVTVTIAPDGDRETVALSAGETVDVSRAIHARGHGVRVVVRRGNETVFDTTIRGYERYELTVAENSTSVEYSVV